MASSSAARGSDTRTLLPRPSRERAAGGQHVGQPLPEVAVLIELREHYLAEACVLLQSKGHLEHATRGGFRFRVSREPQIPAAGVRIRHVVHGAQAEAGAETSDELDR